MTSVSATGIAVMRNSELDCGYNTIRAMVYSNSSEGAARGISMDQSSVVMAHNNDIAARVTSAELPNNCKGVVNTG